MYAVIYFLWCNIYKNIDLFVPLLINIYKIL